MEEQLISYVFHNNCLWDKRNKDFKNIMKKQRIWEEIGLQLKTPDAEEIFKSLRAKYIREKKVLEKTTRSSAAAPTRKEWPWMQHLKFLDDVIAPRRTFSSSTPDERLEEQLFIEAGPSSQTITSPSDTSNPQCVAAEILVEDTLLSPNTDHNYSSCSESFFEDSHSQSYSAIPKTLQRLKPKKRKTDSNQSIDCPQLSELAAALAAPITLTSPPQPTSRWDDGIDIETKLFTQYLAVRLNNLPALERRNFEQKIMKELTDVEREVNK